MNLKVCDEKEVLFHDSSNGIWFRNRASNIYAKRDEVRMRAKKRLIDGLSINEWYEMIGVPGVLVDLETGWYSYSTLVSFDTIITPKIFDNGEYGYEIKYIYLQPHKLW